jgi:hypothetical protein
MRTVRLRVTGAEDPVLALLKRIESMDDGDRGEEGGDSGPHLRDDSSSANLVDDIGATDFHDIEVHATSDAVARTVQAEIARASRELGLVAEFVEAF